MSTIRTPVGPQPKKVYWRRRLFVLLGLVVVALIIVLLVVHRGGTPKPLAKHTPTPVQTSAAAETTCKPSVVDVEAVTDALAYAPGVEPKLSLTITNTGLVPCFFKVGTDVQDYEITTGTQKVWSSKDCQTNPAALTVTLKPGIAVPSTPFAWNRTASSATTCKVTNKKQVIANGASYHLSVSVNGVTSSKTRQFILSK
jgi:hypothetical protein